MKVPGTPSLLAGSAQRRCGHVPASAPPSQTRQQWTHQTGCSISFFLHRHDSPSAGLKAGMLVSLLDFAADAVCRDELNARIAAPAGAGDVAAAAAQRHRRLLELTGDVALMLRDGAAADPDRVQRPRDGRDRPAIPQAAECAPAINPRGAFSRRSRAAARAPVADNSNASTWGGGAHSGSG